ncbi:MAG: apolipoprotein N-acyltransferase [Betaproteobacteria bacterium]|nr:apolipoprotein N-acyltransferase [Betaproteobacteria bacterium]
MAAVRWKPLAAAFALGLGTVGGFAPFEIFLLPVVTLAWLLRLAERAAAPGAAFKLGFAFGLGFFLAGVSWVYVSLHDFGAMPAPLAAGVTLLFCAYLALYPALASSVAVRTRSDWLRRCVVFPGAWVLTEWVRGWLFTGFPWLGIGYSQAAESPLVGIAPVLGVHGVGLALVASAGLALHVFADGWRNPDWRPLAVTALLWVVAAGLKANTWTEPAGEPVRVSLLQGNVAQSIKWRPEQVAVTLRLYQRMILASSAQLIILPETALPMFLRDVPQEFLQAVDAHAKAHGADVLFGLPERGDGGYYNSVVSIGASPSQVYRKSHLVPFGEFIPLRPLLAPVVEAMAIPLTDFSRGTPTQRPLAVAGQRVAVNICYEDVFGEEIIRQLPEATLLVNVSNVAWFGDSIAPRQHLQIAQMRAIETGRPMLRATNTGMTAVVAPTGRVTHVALTFRNATVEAEVRGHTGATPYVRFGNAPALGLAAVFLLAGFVRKPRRVRD